MSAIEEACELTQGCTGRTSQVVVTVNGWVINACGPCAVAACDHIRAVMEPDDDLARFMREQSAASTEYRDALVAAYDEFERRQPCNT